MGREGPALWFPTHFAKSAKWMGHGTFVLSHPSGKNKDAASMGHPAFWIKRGELASAYAEFAGSQVGGLRGSNPVSSPAGRRSRWTTICVECGVDRAVHATAGQEAGATVSCFAGKNARRVRRPASRRAAYEWRRAASIAWRRNLFSRSGFDGDGCGDLP